ncbi:histidinol dehydrogenase [Flavilitoribacter nigricans]|uniref:Histidinol dehydrogenase n=1 Tax=Flavilitoribacter nigricans (strain ATCC 23147 / DSM 23189 / NBRC 102662 / NCIMB 1420 / SS-2) TaxID=1122177 RepID=A0A2D0N3V8_FLAN2|nr:histidinol dehydrogenase [Flavilitoribacter nigricans]PHN03080.1 histidinol dehydrogenase [Flavilitoribacter nigricans DSM 23189 = NBRC 102662]
MKTYLQPNKENWDHILQRPALDHSQLENTVAGVLQEIKAEGDAAVLRYTEKFDGVRPEHMLVTSEEIDRARKSLDPELKAAIQQAAQNIERFHASQHQEPQVVETMPGVSCWRKSVGIEKVGLYIPGGTAPLFSTVLMLGIPARLAGCREIVLCSPPTHQGGIHPAIIYTADLVGITKIFKIGGVQAIGAMAYGTESVPQVYKIFGPGNQYVTAAKQLVNKAGLPIDMPAGPSEVLVCADETADPEYVAADLLSQAEHGTDSQVVLIGFTEQFIQDVREAIDRQLEVLPRAEIARAALDNSAAMVVTERQEALEMINFYAPEHLILSLKQVDEFAEGVINAGSVFLGNYTPESVGDYASGTNHTLPTNGFARSYSGVSLDAFVKKITFQRLSPEGLRRLGPTVEAMAAAEELEAHKQAVSIRLRKLTN